ncbi:hypothetical protein GLW04_03110 [Halobacillus litoralis]|uniref:Uncharacterized protein n=1 Tax=Halobacillus litoralis TaxID=45668 RepID=A0A845DR57_9BACI|nr:MULTISPECIES: hypothetical protein [Halobacillus]MCA1023599.1 hypothetical protein [Halobacillus litoralis]MYL18862.1 hypothetical protein [Halobacillus litoralis]MYL31196.1 hypothetical protein [Halobacillus halophilus]MYL39664.1 hypothetical protein [Halobacillus litoralis]
MKEKLKKDEWFHYIIAIAALVSGLLHFFFNWDYYHHHHYLTSGLLFYTIGPVLYVVCTFAYYKATTHD